jgi:prevent-host-death family protein
VRVIRVSLAEAKARLSELVERAATGEAICIMRRGKPVAQIIAVDAHASASMQRLCRR